MRAPLCKLQVAYPPVVLRIISIQGERTDECRTTETDVISLLAQFDLDEIQDLVRLPAFQIYEIVGLRFSFSQ